MPFDGPNDPKLPENVANLSEDEREQWVAIWNSVFADCMSEKDDTAENSTACEATAFAQANGVVFERGGQMDHDHDKPIQRLWRSIKALFETELTETEQETERAKSLQDIWMTVVDQALEQDPTAWPVDMFRDDDGAMFLVLASNGKLFRANIDAANALGEWIEVVQEFVPVQQANTLRQLDDGTYQLISISGTTVLNRQGEIDSRDLFDSLERYFFEHQLPADEKPLRMFYHQGEAFRTGVIDFVAREGNTLVTCTTYDDTELARREIAARQKEPEYWGDSIGFAGENPELLEIKEGIEIPVYRGGILREVSTLPEAEAAAWFTQGNIQEVVRMNARAQDALVKLFDGDEEAAQAWLAENADDLNRSITESGLLTRAAETETEETETVESEETAVESEVEPTAETPEVDDEEDEDGEVVVEIDDTLLREIAEQVTAPLLAEIERLTAQIDQMAQVANDNAQEQATVNVRVANQIKALQTTDDDKLRQRVADMPRRQKKTAIYRPREAKAPDNGSEPSMADTAENTLKNLP